MDFTEQVEISQLDLRPADQCKPQRSRHIQKPGNLGHISIRFWNWRTKSLLIFYRKLGHLLMVMEVAAFAKSPAKGSTRWSLLALLSRMMWCGYFTSQHSKVIPREEGNFSVMQVPDDPKGNAYELCWPMKPDSYRVYVLEQNNGILFKVWSLYGYHV